MTMKSVSSEKPFKFTIPRSRWLRGYDDSALLDSAGNQCCVGHYLSAVGVPREKLLCRTTANTLVSEYELPDAAKWLVAYLPISRRHESEDASELYELNDTSSGDGFTAKERERRIKEIFAKHDIRVQFTK